MRSTGSKPLLLHRPITYIRLTCAKRSFYRMRRGLFLWPEHTILDTSSSYCGTLRLWYDKPCSMSECLPLTTRWGYATLAIDESGSNLRDTLMVVQGPACPIPPQPRGGCMKGRSIQKPACQHICHAAPCLHQSLALV